MSFSNDPVGRPLGRYVGLKPDLRYLILTTIEYPV